jgi:alditol oxidase
MDTNVLKKQTNWAGNYTYSAANWHSPETVEQVQEIVAHSRRVKALGTRHSFNAIADTTEDMLSLMHFDQVLALDRERHTVTVGAGIRYGTLCQYLNRAGYALHNLASLPHISVAGACATGTHGSGDGNGSLATATTALEMVTADGGMVRLSREQDGEKFAGAVVGLGALGIVTQLTLNVLPAFTMRQDVYQNLPLVHLADHFEEITGGAYSVSLFTDWTSANFNQVWRKSVVTNGSLESSLELKSESGSESESAIGPEWFGATLAPIPMHPIAEVSAESCTTQGGAPGPWHERLPHFRMDYMPSHGDELQSEYLVPRQYALAALRALYELREIIAPHLLISEVRTIATDDLWMSPSYQRDSVALHFTWKQDWPAVEKVLPRIEAQLAPFHARPHWGKLFTTSPAQLQSLYLRLPDFLDLRQMYDPQGKFRNNFLNNFLDTKLVETSGE